MNLNVRRPMLGKILGAAVASAGALALPANALTITPLFDSSITSAGNAADVEGAINTAINTIDALYVNPGNVNIVFKQQNTNAFLGESDTQSYNASYNNYIAQLQANANAHPGNTVLATALANLSHGNDANGANNISGTSALFRILGFSGITPCFNAAGNFVPGCNQSFDGEVTLTDSSSLPFFYSVPPSGPVSGFDAIATVEHEVNEILGGGGQGSTLNAIQQGFTAFDNLFGPLDLYRYDALDTPSFSTSDTSSYFSVNGGLTDIVCFNGNSAGDYADFCTNTNVQSAFSNPNQVPPYDTTTPEFPMMESIGFDGVVPEPASLALLIPALAGLRWVRRRRRS